MCVIPKLLYYKLLFLCQPILTINNFYWILKSIKWIFGVCTKMVKWLFSFDLWLWLIILIHLLLLNHPCITWIYIWSFRWLKYISQIYLIFSHSSWLTAPSLSFSYTIVFLFSAFPHDFCLMVTKLTQIFRRLPCISCFLFLVSHNSI